MKMIFGRGVSEKTPTVERINTKTAENREYHTLLESLSNPRKRNNFHFDQIDIPSQRSPPKTSLPSIQ